MVVMNNYETLGIKGSTKKRLKSIMKYGTTFDTAINTLIDEHIENKRGGC